MNFFSSFFTRPCVYIARKIFQREVQQGVCVIGAVSTGVRARSRHLPKAGFHLQLKGFLPGLRPLPRKASLSLSQRIIGAGLVPPTQF